MSTDERPSARPRGKVRVRDLGPRGVPETNHTSIRLDPADKETLRRLARGTYGGITMSATVRILIREAWALSQRADREASHQGRLVEDLRGGR